MRVFKLFNIGGNAVEKPQILGSVENSSKVCSIKCGPLRREASRDLTAGPSRRCLLLATVAAASTAGKFRKSEAITRLPMVFSR